MRGYEIRCADGTMHTAVPDGVGLDGQPLPADYYREMHDRVECGPHRIEWLLDPAQRLLWAIFGDPSQPPVDPRSDGSGGQRAEAHRHRTSRLPSDPSATLDQAQGGAPP